MTRGTDTLTHKRETEAIWTFFFTVSQPRSDSKDKAEMKETPAHVSVELSQETQGTCSPLTPAQPRRSGCRPLCTLL